MCSVAVDVSTREEVMKIVRSSISTKFIKKWCVVWINGPDIGCGCVLIVSTTVGLTWPVRWLSMQSRRWLWRREGGGR